MRRRTLIFGLVKTGFLCLALALSLAGCSGDPGSGNSGPQLELQIQNTQLVVGQETFASVFAGRDPITWSDSPAGSVHFKDGTTGTRNNRIIPMQAGNITITVRDADGKSATKVLTVEGGTRSELKISSGVAPPKKSKLHYGDTVEIPVEFVYVSGDPDPEPATIIAYLTQAEGFSRPKDLATRTMTISPRSGQGQVDVIQQNGGPGKTGGIGVKLVGDKSNKIYAKDEITNYPLFWEE